VDQGGQEDDKWERDGLGRKIRALIWPTGPDLPKPSSGRGRSNTTPAGTTTFIQDKQGRVILLGTDTANHKKPSEEEAL
jgi:hypothetical protein